jgi:hypothetical protein
LRKSSSGLSASEKSKRPDHIELLDRRAVVEKLQKLNLGGAQVDDGGLNLRLVLHAQQLDAVQVDLGDVAGVEAVAADLDDVVVVDQVLLCHLKNSLGLQRLHKAERRVNIRVRSRSWCCDCAICVPS